MNRFAALLTFGLSMIGEVALSAEIDEPAYGFQCSIPDGFDQPRSHLLLHFGDLSLYHFMDRTPVPGDPANHIIFKRLGEIHEVGRNPKTIPQKEGRTGTLETFEWNQRTFNIARIEENYADEGLFVHYLINFPLSKEAVQLQVIGPVERDQQLRQLFYEVAGNFKNTTPLYGENSVPKPVEADPAKTAHRRSDSIPLAGTRSQIAMSDDSGLLVVAGVILLFLGGLVGIWIQSRKLPRGFLLVIAVVIYGLGSFIGSTQAREIVMLAGTLQMLGFASGILGVIDILRRRSRPPDPASAD